MSGYYRVSVFFLAKVLIDLIPMRILPLCIYTVIAYFMVGKLNTKLSCSLTPICVYCQIFLLITVTSVVKILFFVFSGFTVDVSKFFIFLLTLTLTSLTATSQAFAISSRLRVVAVANLLIALSFVLFMVRHCNINQHERHCSSLNVPHALFLTLLNNIAHIY